MAGAAPIELGLTAIDTRRHWSPSSQPYAPADVLLRYLAEGGQISPIVGLEEHVHAGARRVAVYHFELTKDGQQQILPVQSNPVVRRLLHDRNLRVVHLKRESLAETRPL